MTPFFPSKEGVFYGLDSGTYREAPGINISLLKQAKTPAHFKAARDAKPEEPTAAQIIGTVTHSNVLEPEKPAAFVLKPVGMDFRSTDGKAWKAKQTLPIVSIEDVEAISGMTASVWKHPFARTILGKAQKEVSVFKRDADTGLLLKGRLDAIAVDDANLTTIADLKTTEDASEFEREILKWKMHWQAAFYLDLTGASFFVFIVVEKNPPFAVRVLNLAQQGIDIGRLEYRQKLAVIAECEETGEWPAYSQEIEEINLPEWAVRKANR